jgi:excisionase family DNA binding protein
MSTDTTYGLREAAELLGVHYMTVYRYIRTGRLPAHQAGSQWEISAADLKQFRRAKGHRRTGPESPARLERRGTIGRPAARQ